MIIQITLIEVKDSAGGGMPGGMGGGMGGMMEL
jgi:hypothetical protein